MFHGKSNAFAICKRLGLQEDILNRASKLLTTDHINIEELLKSIYDNKLQIEKEKELIDKNLNQVELLRNSLESDLSNHKQKEKEILEKYNLSNIDVLKVGHHGNKTSSGSTFINKINPKYSIISVGMNNRLWTS